MYLSALSIWLRRNGINSYKEVINEVWRINNKSRISIGFDLVISNILFGSTFQEYLNLKFYDRTYKNRNTFLTSYYNLRYYRKFNDRNYRKYFLDKVHFNEKFGEYIGRDWIDLISSKEQILLFLKKHSKVIMKPKTGDSGKDIRIIDTVELLAEENIDGFIEENRKFILEEVLVNNEIISKLNKTSLNTLRIISIVTKNNVKVLYAGIRVGKAGEFIDNISKGGRVAAIDISTGKLMSGFLAKATSSKGIEYEDICIDESFMLPMWKETLDLVKSAAIVIPQMKYIAWDVAITNKGPVIIEGNHSSGNTVNQVHFGLKQDGLKPRFKEIIKSC